MKILVFVILIMCLVAVGYATYTSSLIQQLPDTLANYVNLKAHVYTNNEIHFTFSDVFPLLAGKTKLPLNCSF